jgi:hypothetical protein
MDPVIVRTFEARATLDLDTRSVTCSNADRMFADVKSQLFGAFAPRNGAIFARIIRLPNKTDLIDDMSGQENIVSKAHSCGKPYT